MLDTWWRRERRGGEDKEGDATSDWQCNGSHDDKQETLIFFFTFFIFLKSTLQKNSLCPYAWQAHTQEETGSCLLTSSRDELSWQRETKRRVVWCPIAMLGLYLKGFLSEYRRSMPRFLASGFQSTRTADTHRPMNVLRKTWNEWHLMD